MSHLALPLAAALLLHPWGRCLAAGSGEVRRVAVESAALGASVPATILLPPSYEGAAGRRYPVVYFLHDARGDEEVLERKGVAARLLAEMEAGRLPELLVVAPRGNGAWFVDTFDGTSRYGEFLDRELVPWVDVRFRTLARREGRAAAGISMGGYGALRWSLRRPELFAVAGGLSAALQPMSLRMLEEVPFFVRPSLSRAFGSAWGANDFRRNDLYQLLLDDPGLAARAPRFVLEAGTGDRYHLGEMASFFDTFVRAAGGRSETVLEAGDHDWSYWRRALLPFAGRLAALLEGPREEAP